MHRRASRLQGLECQLSAFDGQGIRPTSYVNGMAHTNGIESVWAVLKRGINGTFHHVSRKHLPHYLNEFTFRLDEGNVNVHVLDRLDSALSGAEGQELPYKVLTQ